MLIEDTLGEDGDYETIRNIHDTLNDMIEEHKEEQEPLQLDKTDVRKVFEKERRFLRKKMECFDQNYEENKQGKRLLFLQPILRRQKKFSD